MNSLADSTLWATTLVGVLLLFVLDFVVTRRPHEVSMREAAGWSTFYVALPVIFGAWLWRVHGSEAGMEYATGYVVEKSLSIDNLFVFMLLLAGFAVPKALQQRVLLIGVGGALVLRGVMIAIGAPLLESFTWMFLVFGAILLVSAVKVIRDAAAGHEQQLDVDDMRTVRLIRRFYPVTSDYRGSAMSVVERDEAGRTRRFLTPLAVATVSLLAIDAVFAVDSVPAVYGITGDPYLVFVTNAFALLGLRALYFVVTGLLTKLVHLGYGLGAILAFIGYKLVAHWAHGIWSWVPMPSTAVSLGFIVGALATVTVTSLLVTRGDRAATGTP